MALQRRYSFDGILINLPGRDPRWRSHIRRIESRGSGKVIHWANGWHTVCPADDNPHNFRADGREFRFPSTKSIPTRSSMSNLMILAASNILMPGDFPPDRPRPDRFFPPWHYDTIDLRPGACRG